MSITLVSLVGIIRGNISPPGKIWFVISLLGMGKSLPFYSAGVKQHVKGKKG
jgi:hypothetical protein